MTKIPSLIEILFCLITANVTIHYIYLIRGEYPFLFVATIIVILQLYLIVNLLLNNHD